MPGSNVVATVLRSLDGVGQLDLDSFEAGGTCLNVSTYPNQRAAAEIRAALERITWLERELGEVRAVLLVAEAFVDAPVAALVTPDALTTEQVAQALSLSRSTVAEMIRRKLIRSVKIGGARRVFRADLDAYIESVRTSEAAA